MIDGWESTNLLTILLFYVVVGSFLMDAKRSGKRYYYSDGSKTPFNLDDPTNGDCVKIDGSTSKLTSANCSTPAPFACIQGNLILMIFLGQYCTLYLYKYTQQSSL